MEAHRTLDVDTFFLTAGSIVLSDHGLVDFFETPNAVGVRRLTIHCAMVLTLIPPVPF